MVHIAPTSLPQSTVVVTLTPNRCSLPTRLMCSPHICRTVSSRRKQVEKKRPHSAFDYCRYSLNLCQTLAGRSQAGRGSTSIARNCAGTWTDQCATVMRKWCRVAHGECKVCRAECRKRETCGGVSASPLLSDVIVNRTYPHPVQDDTVLDGPVQFVNPLKSGGNRHTSVFADSLSRRFRRHEQKSSRNPGT